MGTVELLHLFFFFSSQKGFFSCFFVLKPVKNVPAPKVILRLRPRVQNLVHVSL